MGVQSRSARLWHPSPTLAHEPTPARLASQRSQAKSEARQHRVSPTEHFHGYRAATAVYRDRHRRRLRAGRARLRADLSRHQCGEFRARRILDGRRLSDGGVRGRSRLALLAVVSAGAGRHGAARRDLQSRGLLSAAAPQLSAGHHRHHRRLDPDGQLGAGDLRPAAAGAGRLVRDAGHPARAGLSRQPVSVDHRGHRGAGDLQLLVLRAHHARQETAGHLAGQGNGLAARHLGVDHDHDHLHLFGGAGRPRRHPGGAESCSCRSRWARPSR